MSEACPVRRMNEGDLPLVLGWRNHPNIRRFMFTQHEITAQEHRNWFDRAQEDPQRALLIVESEDAPIGFVQFNPIGSGAVADWGFYASPSAPKGSGRKLGQAALHHAFNELALHKVCGQAIESNLPSIGFHEKLGFSREGLLRDQQRIGNRYHSLVCFGLLAEEWDPTILTSNHPDAHD